MPGSYYGRYAKGRQVTHGKGFMHVAGLAVAIAAGGVGRYLGDGFFTEKWVQNGNVVLAE